MGLNEGEVICNKCNGRGWTRYTEQRGNGFYPMKTTCTKCKGEGKLDWIENIVGKKKDGSWFHGQGVVHTNLKTTHSYRTMKWSDYEEEQVHYKKSSEEIKEDINPQYRKQLERKIAYNLTR